SFGEQLFIRETDTPSAQGTTLYNGFVNCTPPTCPKPNTLVVSSLTQTGATLTWNEVGTATSWEVIILPAGSPAPLPTDSGDIIDEPTLTVSNLDPGTSYVFYVRAICVEDDLSNWSGPRAFVTVIVNDECENAIPVPVNPDTNCGTVVGGTVIGATASSQPNGCPFSGTDDDDVWFEFVAVTTTHSIDLLNVTGSTGDLYHILYEGDECGNLTQLNCSDDNQSVASNLTPGQTYKIRVYTYFSGAQTTTFDVCIGTIPPPISTSTTLYTVEQLVQDILLDSTCATVSNITYSTGTNFGSTNGIGYFNKNNSSFQFEEGIILTTGNADNAPGPNEQFNNLGDGADATETWGGDADLQAVLAAQGISGPLVNATILEFDFVPLDSNFSFNFIFASEEYGQYQCDFSDVFAFLLTDLSSGTTTNLAVVPDTNTPVSVTTIRNTLYNNFCGSENEEYFGQYYGNPNGLPNLSAPTGFNGLTTPLTASAIVVPGTQYHIKLAIADFGGFGFPDGAFDSAVFIQGGSFNIGNVNLGDDFLVAEGNAICPGDDQLLDTGLSPDNYSFVWSNQDGVIDGETGPSYLVTSPGTYTVEIQLLNSECTGSDTIVIEFFDDFETGEPNDLYFCSASGFGTFDLTENDESLTATLGDNYIIGYYLTEDDA
ncbi:MAG: adhesin, partial [Bacteroidetes bacterium HGW-Bacteroidetes-23]